MAEIRVLDKAVAELIAAGEVVERPASIAKELLENAIDAGATGITIEIEGGGVALLRVGDNGAGIRRDDVPRAFLRHATSKIADANDLEAILTLGFRGEALASIAAVSRVELTTATADEDEGTVCRVEGGELLEVLPAGRAVGTTITVRDVFYNTPARMKFLKKNTSEGGAVAQVVEKCALSHPEIAFRFIRDGQTRLQTTGSGGLLPVIRAIYGKEHAEHMIPVDYVHEEAVGVRGYVSSPAGARPSRAYQSFFINGRFVRSRTAAAALDEAFKNKIMSGRFPACVLHLELDASTVDVNVHPAKTEVRFAQEKPVFSAVYFAVKSALAKLETPLSTPAFAGAARRPEPPAAPRVPSCTVPPDPAPRRVSAAEFRAMTSGAGKHESTFSRPQPLGSFGRARIDIAVDEPAFDTFPTTNRPLSARITEALPEPEPQTALEPDEPYKPIGELMGVYILLERGDALVLVDKHAAHERVLYERLRQNLDSGNRQLLLSSRTVTLPQEDYAALIENPDVLERLGFLAEDFGDGAVVVREIPIELDARDIDDIIAEVAAKLRTGAHDLTPTVLDKLCYSIACKSAVRAGDKNSAPELAEIVRLLDEDPRITHCPHGRPVRVALTRREIEKLFGRQG